MKWFDILQMQFGQMMDLLISWWPVCQVILFIIGWSVIIVQLTQFVVQRIKSYKVNVYTNTLRFNQMQSESLKHQIEAAVKDARCSKCGQSINSSTEPDDEDEDLWTTKFTDKVAEARNHFPVKPIRTTDNSTIDNNCILNVSRMKNRVSKLTRKFENTGVSPKYNLHKSIPVMLSRNYFVNETSSHEEPICANPSVKPSPLIISTPQSQHFAEPDDESSCSSSSPEVRYRKIERRSGSSLRNSMDNILERDEWANSSESLIYLERSHSTSDVRTVEDIIRQERFSKCFSEYSISDLLNDITSEADDTIKDDVDLTLFLNRMD